MLADSVQRFAIAIVVFGGFLTLSNATGDYDGGLFSLGVPIMLFGLASGFVGVAMALDGL
ncbi:hypothetical protein [Halorussus amylolyticus]|uniref:hypothetical protein n=1 Tax=Halorussus amylolyticus TaxID=1126242 RepID=UPI00138F3504|nr:hypothetical protein [Halorussus amylolyticus]